MTGPLTGIDVLLLAGGKGTRIKPVLGDVAKITAPINGRTMLERQVERLEQAGADRIIASVPRAFQTQPETYHVAIGVPESVQAETNTTYIREPRPLGTVAAVRFAAHLLYSNPVVIINGDTWAEVDWTEYLKVWEVDTDLAYAVDKDGKNAGHYMVSQNWLRAVCGSPYKLIEDAVAKMIMKKHRIKIPSFIDIGTPEGLEKAREVIK